MLKKNIMFNKRLEEFCELVKDAHSLIQEDYKSLNPIVGINQKMRNAGIPADILTVDCLKSDKRIIIILNDNLPDTIEYQLLLKDKDPDDRFEKIKSDEFSSDTLYSLIEGYFTSSLK